MRDVIGIPWCRKENYDTLRSIFENPNNLPSTWTEFAKAADEAQQHYQGSGAIVERVEIDPHTLAEWCASHGYRVDSRAHFRYANWVAKREHSEHSK